MDGMGFQNALVDLLLEPALELAGLLRLSEEDELARRVGSRPSYESIQLI